MGVGLPLGLHGWIDELLVKSKEGEINFTLITYLFSSQRQIARESK